MRRYEIWSMTGEERQAKESCLAGLKMVGGPEPANAPGRGYLYRLAPAHGGLLPDLGLLHEDSLLMLSLEGRHAIVAQCNVASCDGKQVTVLLQRPLNESLMEQGNQPGARWRLDVDEGASPFQTMRENMFKLIRSFAGSLSFGAVLLHTG